LKQVFISLGTNIEPREERLAEARHLLKAEEDCSWQESKIYETEPWGVKEQADFLNQVVGFMSKKTPHELLKLCKDIEEKMGRQKREKWKEREIDLDLLYCGDCIVNEENLTLPHPRIAQREFVLRPLCDIMFRPASQRGLLPFNLGQFGTSTLGAPLLYAPSKNKCKLLAIAGIHGEEPESTFLLSRTLRHFAEPLQNVAFILCANPDGTALGTRGNANGVDLNRNFPTANWSAEITLSKASLESERITELSPGSCAGGEAETKALVEIIRKLEPKEILSIHSPLACVDAPKRTPLTNFLVNLSETEYKTDIGYPTPGSLGTWCKENLIHCVTWELPRLAPEILAQKFAEKLAFYFSKTV
jgi:protein MpaA